MSNQAVWDGSTTRIASSIEVHADSPPDLRVVSDARRRYRLLSVAMAAADSAVLVVALIVAHHIRYGAQPAPGHSEIVLLQAPLIWIAVFFSFGLYSSQRVHPVEEVRRLMGAVGVGVAAVMVLAFWPTGMLSRAWIGMTFLIALGLEAGVRFSFRRYSRRLRADGRLSLRTLVVGRDFNDSTRVENLLKTSNTGFLPIASLAAEDDVLSQNGSTTAGHEQTLRALIRSYGTDCIFLASASLGGTPMKRIMRVARQEGVDVHVLAEMGGVLSSRVSINTVTDSTMALSLRPAHLTKRQQITKRAFDMVMASIGLILTTPLWLAAAIAIKLNSKGPILFRQERVTRGGKSFMMMKFRTMHSHADEMLRESGRDPKEAFFKWDNDPRITRVGKFLRKASLDELPQLLNVLMGSMSMIGPRPLPVEQVLANPDLAPRHEVAAGVSGWWQINGRSDVDPMKALDMDLFYIENWSSALDLYILLKTFQVVFARRGAF